MAEADFAFPEVHRFSLRFRDPALEATFWTDTAPERAQYSLRNVRPQVLVLIPALVVFFATRSSWPASARGGATLAMAALWVLLVAFGLLARTAWFLRHSVRATGAILATIGAAWIAVAAAAPPSFAPYGLALIAIMLMRGLQVTTMPVLPLSMLVLALAAGYLAVVPTTSGFDADTTSGHALILLAAIAFGMPRMRDNHLAARREFVYRRLSERLVEATLPKSIAARLRANERKISDRHDEVSIVFADLVGFTRLTQRVAPTELAALLDKIFTRLDELAAAEGVEKIKTIGDCYMAAAGLPEACADHALRAARLALAVRDAVAEVCRETGHALEVRIGLDVGPVIAGVLGRNKLVYDLWGDAVNMASRMESHGEPGEIHMSDAFRRVLGDRARVRDRGTIDVKGKGPMQTWFLDGLGEMS
jgi:guanylate cyclase